jgi:hypothetical protein
MTATPPRPLSRRIQAKVMRVINIPMRRILRLPFPTPLGNRLMLVSLTGRRSGKQYRQPVSYVRQDATLLTPGGGKRELNLREGQPIRIRLRGRDIWAHPGDHPGSRRPTRPQRLAIAIKYGFAIVRWHLLAWSARSSRRPRTTKRTDIDHCGRSTSRSMQLATLTLTPLATQRDRVSTLAPLDHAPETTGSSAAPTSTHSDEGEGTSRTSARTDQRRGSAGRLTHDTAGPEKAPTDQTEMCASLVVLPGQNATNPSLWRLPAPLAGVRGTAVRHRHR